MSTQAPDSKLLGLSTLLQLEKDVRHAETIDKFNFLVVNDARRLIEFHQAILWKLEPTGHASIKAVSGLAEIDRNAPYIIWLKKVFRHLLRQPDARQPHVITREALPPALHDGWSEWSLGRCLWCPILTPSGKQLGGLWLNRKREWEPGEISLLEHLCDAYGHAWSALVGHQQSWHERLLHRLHARKSRWVIAAAIVILLLLPVHQTVLAPAEVIAYQPDIISAPLEGVIKTFHVEPNSTVAAGDLLFSMDDTTLRNRHEIARKAEAVAQANYMRAAQKAFTDEESKAELALLNARVEEKSAEVSYTAELLEKIHVHAEHGGIAVFSDANDWLGKPVVIGEKVLTLADPEAAELQIHLPVDDAINLEPGAQVRMFLNIDPTRPLDAQLRQASYEAEITPDDILAFRLKASFDADTALPRIGLKGTAKIYGNRVPLFYYLMRRPIGALRQTLGI
jgi:hypothetical protein